MGISAYFHPKQIAEIKDQFGVTLPNAKGLISLQELSKTLGMHPSTVLKWIKKNKIKPEGKYWQKNAGTGFFFRHAYIKELKKSI